MAYRKKPDTQKKMIEELWDIIIGTNGDGLIEEYKRHEAKDQEKLDSLQQAIEGLTASVSLLTGKLDGHIYTARPSRKQINKQRVIEVSVVALIIGALMGGTLLLFLGVLAPDDIQEFIRAWRGG